MPSRSGGVVIGDDCGYEVGDFYFGRVSARGSGAFRATVLAALAAPERVVQVRIVPSVISPQTRSILSKTAAA